MDQENTARTPRCGPVVDCLDAEPLELFKLAPHVLEHLRGVRLPVQDLASHSQWLPGAVGPRRVAREPLVRQVGVILEGACGFYPVDSAWSLAHRQFRSPNSRIQGCSQVNVVRLPSLAEIGAIARFEQVPRLQVSLRAVVEGPGIGGLGRHAFVLHKHPIEVEPTTSLRLLRSDHAATRAMLQCVPITRPTSRRTRCGSCTPMSTPGLPGRGTLPQRISLEHSSRAPPSSGPATALPSCRPSMQ